MPSPHRPPPPAQLLAYRFAGWRLGPDHRDWVLDDITRRGWLFRQGTPALCAVLLIGATITALLDGDPDRVLTVVLVLAAGGLVLRRSLQERALRQQGIDASGRQLPEAPWYDDAAARVRRNALSAAATVVLVLAGLTLLATRGSS